MITKDAFPAPVRTSSKPLSGRGRVRNATAGRCCLYIPLGYTAKRDQAKYSCGLSFNLDEVLDLAYSYRPQKPNTPRGNDNSEENVDSTPSMATLIGC
mmetsp:Transcript_23749/g.93516  ORF Transcript_23749/g.93516 Transcript_23749/m.93516 type:complete len:98 (+) Transcript_23749:811-1104(+)